MFQYKLDAGILEILSCYHLVMRCLEGNRIIISLCFLRGKCWTLSSCNDVTSFFMHSSSNLKICKHSFP